MHGHPNIKFFSKESAVFIFASTPKMEATDFSELLPIGWEGTTFLNTGIFGVVIANTSYYTAVDLQVP
jgi:hypothetical protein